jgi:AbrB family looped-hinge helix DNA binding protein
MLIPYRRKDRIMKTVESRITSKGQVTLPAAVRRKLNVAPGARVEWVERDGEAVMRRSSRYSSQDIHVAVFGDKGQPVSVPAMDDGIRKYLKKKHARLIQTF